MFSNIVVVLLSTNLEQHTVNLFLDLMRNAGQPAFPVKYRHAGTQFGDCFHKILATR